MKSLFVQILMSSIKQIVRIKKLVLRMEILFLTTSITETGTLTDCQFEMSSWFGYTAIVIIYPNLQKFRNILDIHNVTYGSCS